LLQKKISELEKQKEEIAGNYLKQQKLFQGAIKKLQDEVKVAKDKQVKKDDEVSDMQRKLKILYQDQSTFKVKARSSMPNNGISPRSTSQMRYSAQDVIKEARS
jgi:hypothetical protein